MTVVDDLVTRYRLDPTEYAKGAKQVTDHTNRTGHAMDAASAKMAGMVGVARTVGFALGAVAAGVTAVGIASMQSAAKFDTYQRMFGAALGSVEAGKQTMSDLEDYATRSAFSLDALTQAAKMLAAGGMDISRFLPIVERFALVVSGVDPSGLEMVAGAMLRAKGGGFGEAMEIFRRAGVGTPELQASGIDVSKGGEIKATSDVFLKAIESISQGRLKTMADAISGGDENKLANVGDVVGQAFRRVGAELNERFLPYVVAFSTELKSFIDSGGLEAVVTGFSGLATVFNEDDITGALREFGVTLRAMTKLAQSAKDNVEGLPPWLKKLGEFLGMGAQMTQDFMTMGLSKGLREWIGGAFTQAAKEDEMARMGMGTKMGAAMGGALGGAMAGGASQPEPEANKYLKEIAANTQRQVNLMRGALGGGDIGAMGIGQVELSGMRRSGGAGRDAMRLINLGVGMIAYGSVRAGTSGRMR